MKRNFLQFLEVFYYLLNLSEHDDSNVEEQVESDNERLLDSNARAVYVGINYLEKSYLKLSGCIRDAEELEKYFKTTFNVTEYEMLVDDGRPKSIMPTRSNILKSLTSMLKKSKKGDVCIFTYSGHGSQVRDDNGDEKDGKDEIIIPSDVQNIRDDELHEICAKYLKEGVKLFCFMDCCNSASNFDISNQYVYDKNGRQIYYKENDENDIKGTVVSIAGSSDDKYSYETMYKGEIRGALTVSFIECMKKTSIKSWKNLMVCIDSMILNVLESIQQPHLNSTEPIEKVPFLKKWFVS